MDALPGIRFGEQIAAAARAHGLDPRLLAAVAAQETGGPGSNSGANVVGDGGHGHGLFQLDDRYHPIARTAAAMDPARNADYAAGLLAGLLRKFGDLRAALAAYNSGSPAATGSVTLWADGAHLGYADSVMRHAALLGVRDRLIADASAPSTPPGRAGPAAVPAAGVTASYPQLPAFTPRAQIFRSYQSEVSNGGGEAAARSDRAMAAAVDPSSGSDAQDATSEP